MPRNPESRGTCSFCGEVVTKCGIIKHVEKCPKLFRVPEIELNLESQAVKINQLVVG